MKEHSMEEPHSPENILGALGAIENELIALVGGAWPELEPRYRDLRKALDDRERKWLASVEIIELFSPYDAARERLNRALLMQDPLACILLGLATIADQLQLDSTAVVDAAQLDSGTRRIIMNGPDKARSIKLGNIDFDFGEMGPLVAGIITTVHQIMGGVGAKPYVLAAAGVLLSASSLYKAMNIELSERDATVFYGFTQAAGEDKTAVEADIREKANAAREEIGLKPLDEADVKNALRKLAELKGVARAEEKAATWRIIEKYRVKG
jgi:hypothetical protein